MPTPSHNAFPESLSGLIERVTFFNEENGFAVLKVKVKGHREPVTIVGSLPSVNPGEWVTAEGSWVQNRDFGSQFQAKLLRSAAPTTREGIEKYLGSGMVKGIGPVYAKKLVSQFGEQIFDIIEQQSARLEEVDGIGPKRRHQIKAAWVEQKVVRQIMVFLHSQGVSTSRAVRIYKTYGQEAIEQVRSNPYGLARDIVGIGFHTADQIARNLGIPRDSLVRAMAGLSHVLLEATQEGHCALPLGELLAKTVELLEVDAGVVERALERTLTVGDLISEPIGDQHLVFIPSLRHAEEVIAARVRELVQSPPPYPPIHLPKAVAWCEARTGMTLAPSQRLALEQILSHRAIILTGGPGVGKTTLIHSVLLILRAKKVRCQLCAPTGRAAKRLGETTGLESKTIHRLLEVQPGSGAFARKESHPLECDLLVVDECSMVDVVLMHHLLRALPAHGCLLLVGDVDQLPSVGPGLVLRDLISSGKMPTVHLTEVFRQAAHSRIILNAHRMNQGLLPESAAEAPANVSPADAATSDFYVVPRDEPPAILETLLEVVHDRIPRRFGLDPIRDIQVLCPMNRGSLGIRELNVQLQNTLNPTRPNDPEVEKYGWRFRIRDKVIQIRNNYDKDVFNGDIGIIAGIDLLDQTLTVEFDRKEVRYELSELDELALAYAITIHKAQGSEFPAVVIPLAMQQYLLLQRNLIYTGVTRGKSLVVLIGQQKALAMAVRNHRTQLRYSGLLERLKR